ncbi:MAG: sugar phosphate isomerase/epimerase [Planctomycetaceae bacterium]|nr:sugar phosphate isomerase/epimerase [Planctomycetaceae bacterium]
MTNMRLNRRQFGAACASTVAATVLSRSTLAAERAFRLNGIVASCMYGKAPLAEILPEVRKCGAETIELWAAPHGSQREEIDELGEERVRQMLAEHDIQLGSVTCFKLGLFGMQNEMRLVKRLGGDMVICNSGGPAGLEGDQLRAAIAMFAEKLKPHVEAAEEIGVTIGIENHGGGLISSPESLEMIMDALPSERLGIALAPYHLPQDTDVISRLIRRLGSRLVHFQAWEHGMGCMVKLPKDQELLQLPHRGPLDWVPLLSALKEIDYAGRTEIFMHPVPRGVPILDSTAAVTAEINQAREYLEECLAQI